MLKIKKIPFSLLRKINKEEARLISKEIEFSSFWPEKTYSCITVEKGQIEWAKKELMNHLAENDLFAINDYPKDFINEDGVSVYCGRFEIPKPDEFFCKLLFSGIIIKEFKINEEF